MKPNPTEPGLYLVCMFTAFDEYRRWTGTKWHYVESGGVATSTGYSDWKGPLVPASDLDRLEARIAELEAQLLLRMKSLFGMGMTNETESNS